LIRRLLSNDIAATGIVVMDDVSLLN